MPASKNVSGFQNSPFRMGNGTQFFLEESCVQFFFPFIFSSR